MIYVIKCTIFNYCWGVAHSADPDPIAGLVDMLQQGWKGNMKVREREERMK